ncbi:unnamed protein product [Orchesella dallaii]|uniref:NFX1-type zinc finger-containing protein 1 n=1 Tax=Orchesella dallaii TaxID=48710 RepID=A0ABP1RZR9_9HEXA
MKSSSTSSLLISESLLTSWLEDDFLPTAVISEVHDKYLEPFQNLIDSLTSASKRCGPVMKKTLLLIGTKLAAFNVNGGEDEDETGGECSRKQVKLLTIVCKDKFLEVVTRNISLLARGPEKKEVGEMLVSIRNFCEVVMDKMPLSGKDVLVNLICACMGVLMTFEEGLSQQHPNLLQEFTSSHQKIVEVNKQLEVEAKASTAFEFTEKFELMLHDREPPENFRKIQIIPTLEELLQNKRPFLRPNKIKGAYYDAEHYLDVQFRLLREDFVQPLRRGMEDFLQNKDEYLNPKGKRKFRNANQQNDTSVQIYTEIMYYRTESAKEENYDCDETYLFKLPPGLIKGVDWSKSKKLMAGTLVMLTADFCKTAILATTLSPPLKKDRSGRGAYVNDRRSELAKGILRLKIETGEELVEVYKPYIMLECEAYFEACRYNLDILQKITFLNEDANNPMSKFIVNAYPNVNLPTFFKDGDLLKLPIAIPQPPPPVAPIRRFGRSQTKLPPTKYLEVQVKSPTPDENEDAWPSQEIKTALQLDVDQYAAYKMALTSELAIIQGPPGTGKTFIGLQIVKTLLLNKQRAGVGIIPNSPILVLCYTNHALDQFLELLVKDKASVVRVGGQSKSEALRSCSLPQQRRYFRGGCEKKKVQRQVLDGISKIEKRIHSLKKETSALEDVHGLLNFEKFKLWERILKMIPESLAALLQKEEDCTKWLGLSDEAFVSKEFQVSNVLNEWFGIGERKQQQLKNSNNQLRSPASQNWLYFKEGLPSKCFAIASAWSAEFEKFKEVYKNNYFVNDLRVEDEMLVNAVYKVFHYMRRVENTNRKYRNKGNLLNVICTCFHQEQLEPAADIHGILTEKEDVQDKYILKDGDDLSHYSPAQRWGIYFKVVQITIKIGRKALAENECMLKDAKRRLKVVKDEMDGEILKNADIIGMTTTGGAKHNFLLENAKPQIVVIEEAAEILEAHVITSLTQDCKHLILIGDHFQLRPSNNVYQLERKYHMNVSLFERMILNDVKMCTLKTQHRMRPEISDLITGSIYETLHNHQSVFRYPPVKGVTKSLFFLCHSELESQDKELMSKSNRHEAQFMAGLCEYLILQGYLPSEITVLTTYTGQMFLLKNAVSAKCRDIYVTCVDSYQGEENKIILLSLVRSNTANKIGFVGIENRVCVALSRAKHGMFIVGNLSSFIKVSKIWKQIHEKLQSKMNCGDELELKCAQHGKITNVKCGRDFLPLLPGGGCGGLCNAALPKCSHLCPQKCHGLDRLHTEFKCKEKCKRKCKAGNHDCESKCYVQCPPCQVPVLRQLPCKHELHLPCHENYLTWRCDVKVRKILPCDHQLDVACSMDPKFVLCKTKINKTLKCGHVKVLECYKDVALVKCEEPVEKTLVACGHNQILKCSVPPSSNSIICLTQFEHTFENCGHNKLVTCWKLKDTKCDAKCKQELECGHECLSQCHVNKDPDHLTYKCRINCSRLCASGTHECASKHPCHQRCRPCKVKVSKTLLCDPRHFAVIPCHVDRKNHKCDVMTEKRLECGHEKEAKCHEDIKNIVCDTLVRKVFPECGHEKEAKCHEYIKDIVCDTVVSKVFPECGHEKEAKCHEDIKEIVCDMLVSKVFPECGHTVSVPCSLRESQLCPCTLVSRLAWHMRVLKTMKSFTTLLQNHCAINRKK